jgi:hypothetical protein
LDFRFGNFIKNGGKIRLLFTVLFDKMVCFIYSRREENSGQDNDIIVQAGPDDVIFVPLGYLPLKVNRETSTDPFGEFHNVETEYDRREIYVLIHIDDLYEKFDQSIFEHYQYDGWEEDWAWNIDTMKFENRPRPSGQNHCWGNPHALNVSNRTVLLWESLC